MEPGSLPFVWSRSGAARMADSIPPPRPPRNRRAYEVPVWPGDDGVIRPLTEDPFTPAEFVAAVPNVHHIHQAYYNARNEGLLDPVILMVDVRNPRAYKIAVELEDAPTVDEHLQWGERNECIPIITYWLP